ncbi:MAG: gliding motility-associated C-terminal domain-containing protein [Thermoanaerobaculia bacterium]|nr:gliding motility-associated C-terminal domain-containing protein [Thermoanaerobaculia bacterium]
MQKLLLFLITVFALLPGTPQSQNFFQNTFALPGYSVHTGGVAQLTNGRIALGGRISNEQTNEQGIAILNLSAAGNLLWAVRLDAAGSQPGGEILSDLLAAPNGKILAVLGKDFAAAGVSGMVQLEADGAIAWSKRLGGAADLFAGISPLTDGYLLQGSSGYPQKGLLVKIGPDGQEIWRKTLSQPGAPMIFYDSWEDTQGFLYVVGEVVDQDGVFLKFNAVGELVWARRLGTTDPDKLRAIVPMPDGKVLLGGSAKGFDHYFKVWLTQTDLSGTIRWSSTYGSSGDDFELQDLIPTAQGPVFSLSGLGAAPNLGAGMARVNDNGDLLWVKDYDPAGQFSRAPQLGNGANNSLITAASLQTGAGTVFYVVSANASGDAPPCCLKSGNLTVTDINIPSEVFVPDAGTIAPLLAGDWTTAALALQQSQLCEPAHVEIALSDSLICPGECIDLSIVDPTPGVNYSWSYPGGKPQPGNPNRVCFPDAAADVLITLFANDCPFQQDTALLRLSAAEEQFPNAFTPNGDGDNDRFLPVLYCPVSQYLFRVYNRWGELMFETANPAQGWDGTFNGLEASSDVYAWVVEYQGGLNATAGLIQKKGSVTLLR